MRNRRALAALGPLAGLAGALSGLALGWNGLAGIEEIGRAISRGEGLVGIGFYYFLGAVLTLAAHGIALARNRPFHAAKAAAVIGALLFAPSWGLGRLASEWAGC